MTTNTSPGQTSNETSRTAATQPVFVVQLAAREVGVRRADDPLGVRAEDLPDALGADQRLAGAIDAVPVRWCCGGQNSTVTRSRAQ